MVGSRAPVLAAVVLLWVVFLVVGEERIEADTLLKVRGNFTAANVLSILEVAKSVDACLEESVPVNALQLDVSIVFLVLEVQGLAKVDIWPLDGVHVLPGHVKLTEVEVLWEYLHFS